MNQKRASFDLVSTKCAINTFRKMEKYAQLKTLVLSLEEDFAKFYQKSNKAAGTRVRKGMQDLKNLAQEIRVEVQNSKSAD